MIVIPDLVVRTKLDIYLRYYYYHWIDIYVIIIIT
jgi:hypothetical protein